MAASMLTLGTLFATGNVGTIALVAVVAYIAGFALSWGPVVWVLLFGRFVLPFFLLLPRSIKFRGAVLAAVGIGLVAGHYLDIYWLVMPILHAHGPRPSLWDAGALCAVVGTSGLAAALWLRGKAVVPVGDPVLAQSVAYRSPT